MQTIKAKLKHDKASHSFKTFEDDKKTSKGFFYKPCAYIEKVLEPYPILLRELQKPCFWIPTIDTSSYIIQWGSNFTPQKSCHQITPPNKTPRTAWKQVKFSQNSSFACHALKPSNLNHEDHKKRAMCKTRWMKNAH